MINLYTIGFTNKSAKSFFGLLESNLVNKVIDTRINNISQLSGFAKGKDLGFFLSRISGIGYEHNIEFAPTKELLEKYRKNKIDWDNYTTEYLNLLDIRRIKHKIHAEELNKCCLLCSEHSPEKCHRRLLAEYFHQIDKNICIVHLK